MPGAAERRNTKRFRWWEFIDAKTHSIAYQKFLATGITRSLVAAHAETASTKTIGNIFVQLLLDVLDPLVATSDRVLDGPTNQVWVYPWLQYVRRDGRDLHAPRRRSRTSGAPADASPASRCSTATAAR